MSHTRITHHLRESSLFEGLTEAEVDALAGRFEIVVLDQGERVCVEGAAGGALWVLERGRLRVHKAVSEGREETLAVLDPGAVLGEVAALDGRACSATVTVLEPGAVLFRLDRPVIEGLRASMALPIYKVLRNTTSTLCARIRQTNARMRSLQARSTESPSPAAPRPRPRRRAAEDIVAVGWESADERDTLSFLSRIPRLGGMTRGDLAGLEQILVRREVPHGEVICREGDTAECLFIIELGVVEVGKAFAGGLTAPLTSLRAGSMFGEVSLVDSGLRSATCVARGPVSLLTLPREDFEALWQASDPMALRFVEAIGLDLSLRLRAVDEQFAALFQGMPVPPSPTAVESDATDLSTIHPDDLLDVLRTLFD